MIIDYFILSPTKNITALVFDDNFCDSDYKKINDIIMKKHAEVEQVGFVSFVDNKPHLRMAGGEFCGNATISTASLFCYLSKIKKANLQVSVFGSDDSYLTEVNCIDNVYFCSIMLPKPKSIKRFSFDVNGKVMSMPVVCLDGISHIIADNSFDKNILYPFLKKYSDEFSVPAIGLMIYDDVNGKLDPVVYVKSCDTLFFESSCASGSCAVGAYLTRESDNKQIIDLIEPGGILSVESSKNDDFIKLIGQVEIIGRYSEKYER